MSEGRRSWQDGALVVFGAVIAAVAGVIGPLVVQHREDRRITRREAQAARGAARVILGSVIEAAGKMNELERERILRRFERPTRVVLPQLVAEKLDGDTWARAQYPLTNVAALADYVKTRIAEGGRRLTDDEACFIRADLAALRDVANIFAAKLADAPRDPPRRPPVDCGRAARPYGV